MKAASTSRIHNHAGAFFALGLLLALFLLTPPCLAAQGTDTAQAREAFLELLDGAHLEGKFTVVGQDGQVMQRDDLYSVSTLRPGEGDEWVFEYRMSYGGNQDTAKPLEIPVRVLFPDGTPLLTMTEQEVPGLGTFSVRLVFHGDHYAGMWSNGPVGGHMWGTVKRNAASDE